MEREDAKGGLLEPITEIQGSRSGLRGKITGFVVIKEANTTVWAALQSLSFDTKIAESPLRESMIST